jgi:ornithine cyclodeaminase/alanine dehydrogenase-like protein (mu-crystallin family)
MPPAIPILDEALLRELVSPADAVAAVRAAYADYGRTRQVLSRPEAMDLTGPDGRKFKLKGGYAADRGVAGFRLIAFGTGELVSHCIVLDATSGALLGLVEESWLHRLRTAASAAAAAGWLARRGPLRLAIIGGGRIASELPAVFDAVAPLAELRVWARNPETAERFARRHAGFGAVATVSIGEATRNADVIVTATAATAPLLRAADIAPGALLIALGGGPELALDVLDAADRLIVDDMEFAATLGSVAGWLAAGRSRADVAAKPGADIGEIAIGSKPGRRDDDERIVAVLQGMASCDVALAAAALETARVRGLAG